MVPFMSVEWAITSCPLPRSPLRSVRGYLSATAALVAPLALTPEFAKASRKPHAPTRLP